MDIDEFGSSGLLGNIPEAFRRNLGLKSLESIVDSENGRGAARLFACPSFEPITATTIVFYDDKVVASLAVSGEDVWERIACGEDLPSNLQVSSALREVAAAELPSQFQTWEVFAKLLWEAKSCMSNSSDEIPYYHFAYGEGVDSSAVWFNPTKNANPHQCELIEAYLQVKRSL